MLYRRSGFFVLLLLTACQVLPSARSPEKSALAEGIAALQAGDGDAAIAHFSSVIEAGSHKASICQARLGRSIASFLVTLRRVEQDVALAEELWRNATDSSGDLDPLVDGWTGFYLLALERAASDADFAASGGCTLEVPRGVPFSFRLRDISEIRLVIGEVFGPAASYAMSAASHVVAAMLQFVRSQQIRFDPLFWKVATSLSAADAAELLKEWRHRYPTWIGLARQIGTIFAANPDLLRLRSAHAFSAGIAHLAAAFAAIASADAAGSHGLFSALASGSPPARTVPVIAYAPQSDTPFSPGDQFRFGLLEASSQLDEDLVAQARTWLAEQDGIDDPEAFDALIETITYDLRFPDGITLEVNDDPAWPPFAEAWHALQQVVARVAAELTGQQGEVMPLSEFDVLFALTAQLALPESMLVQMDDRVIDPMTQIGSIAMRLFEQLGGDPVDVWLVSRLPTRIGIRLDPLSNESVAARDLLPAWTTGEGFERQWLIEAEAPTGAAPAAYITVGNAAHFVSEPEWSLARDAFDPATVDDALARAYLSDEMASLVELTAGTLLDSLYADAFFPYVAWQDPTFAGVIHARQDHSGAFTPASNAALNEAMNQWIVDAHAYTLLRLIEQVLVLAAPE